MHKGSIIILVTTLYEAIVASVILSPVLDQLHKMAATAKRIWCALADSAANQLHCSFIILNMYFYNVY